MQSGQRGLLEREQIRALWDLEAERQECSLQPCRQEMEPGLAKSPAICMWRWERKVVRFDCLPCRSHASDHVLRLSPFLLSVPITKAVKIQAPGFLFPAWPRLAPPGPASPPPPKQNYWEVSLLLALDSSSNTTAMGLGQQALMLTESVGWIAEHLLRGLSESLTSYLTRLRIIQGHILASCGGKAFGAYVKSEAW